MNKTTTYLAFAALIGLVITGTVVLLIVRPDATATLVTQATILLGILASFAAQANNLETIKKNTNGTLSKATEERQAAERRAQAAEARVAALEARLGTSTPGGRHAAADEDVNA
jgi:mannitol-specific phosphotransferase system IIBC component